MDLPPPFILGLRVSGDLAGFTYYTNRRGRTVAYLAAPPLRPPTPAQLVWRGRWRTAMANWRSLPPSARTAYRAVCDYYGLCMLGHNLWLHLCLGTRTELWFSLQRGSRISLAPLIPA